VPPPTLYGICKIKILFVLIVINLMFCIKICGGAGKHFAGLLGSGTQALLNCPGGLLYNAPALRLAAFCAAHLRRWGVEGQTF
jgi:hypothetical protein